MSISPPASGAWTAARLYEAFGAIPLGRIRFQPAPGTACEEDVVSLREEENRLYELVDGVLVEKDVGYYESYLAGLLVQWIGAFVRERDLGFVLPPDGMARLAPGLIRSPDVSFVSWDRLPNREFPDDPVPSLPPDLAVEVISRGNTEEEMNRKLLDYFAAGVRGVWYIYPEPKEVRVYTSPDTHQRFGESETVSGEPVLPGFQLIVSDLFAKPVSSEAE